MTEVSTPDQVKRRLEEEKRRTFAWALNCPVEAADKEDKEAGDQLSRAQADSVKAQERLNKAVQAILQRNSDLDAAIKEKADAEKALGNAVESRKQKEKRKKASEQKMADEMKKTRKGAKDYGHDYHPVPKADEIKGLGDLTKGAPKTPKQNGGGNDLAGMAVKRVRFTNGIPSMGSLRINEVVMAAIWARLTLQL